MPAGCESTGNCDVLFSYSHEEDENKFKVTIEGKAEATNSYLAAGFSSDSEMGDDLVVSCRLKDSSSQPTFKFAYNIKTVAYDSVSGKVHGI